MKVNKNKVKVNIKTESSRITGSIYLMPGGRISDYLNSVSNKFIPVTDVAYFNRQSPNDNGNSEIKTEEKFDLIFLNVNEIKMLVESKDH